MPGSCEATPNKFYAESRNFRRKIRLSPQSCCVCCREAADTTCRGGAASQVTARAQEGEDQVNTVPALLFGYTISI
jgi:hypothetical protein